MEGEPGGFEPAFAEGAFSIAKKGDIKEVKTSFGYHLIRLDEVYPEKYVEFKEVKDAIKASKAMEKSAENLDKFLEEQKK